MLDELKRAFRPEFLNRIDEVIVFHSGSARTTSGSIVQLMLERVNRQLEERAISRVPLPEAVNFLIEKGFDATYGARQLSASSRSTSRIRSPSPSSRAGFRMEFRSRSDCRGDGLVFEPASESTLSLAER